MGSRTSGQHHFDESVGITDVFQDYTNLLEFIISVTIVKKQCNEYADYLVSSFDKWARAQNHSLQRLDFIVL